MARIRSFHPELWADEEFASLEPLARLLFLGLQTHADDQGVFRWKPSMLRSQVLPLDPVRGDELLAALLERDLVRRFSHDGHEYAAIRGFRRHQRPTRPTSSHPLPRELVDYVGLQGAEGWLRLVSGSEPSRPALRPINEDSLSAHPRRGEERRGVGEPGSSSLRSEHPLASLEGTRARGQTPQKPSQDGQPVSPPGSPSERSGAQDDPEATSTPERAATGQPRSEAPQRRGPPNRKSPKAAPPSRTRCLEILEFEFPELQAIPHLARELGEWWDALAETPRKRTWATERAWRLMLRRLAADPGHAVRAVRRCTEGSADGPWLGIEHGLEQVHRQTTAPNGERHAGPRTGKW